MLTLSYLDKQKCVTEDEIKELMLKNTALLHAAKQGEEKYADSLGWLDPDEWAGDDILKHIEKTATEIRASADAFVIVGVGGSNNSARSVIEALKGDDGPEIIYMGNTLSPHALNRELKKLEHKSFFINCIAKNFETLEPGAAFRVLRGLLDRQYGVDAAKRIIATGTPGSELEAVCKENRYTFIQFPSNIGGRYSAISSVGLLPMAVAGIDIRTLVSGVKAMRTRLLAEDAEDNMALRYACIRNLLYRRGYRLEMLSSFEPQYRWFFKWWTQLFAESEGKEGKGLLPISAEYSEELHSVGQYVQDGESLMFETFLTVKEPNSVLIIKADGLIDGFSYLNGKDLWDINRIAFEATRSAHSQKLPCLTLEVNCMDAESFGELFYFFQFACYLSGRILGVNPFDQPGVEAYKSWMFASLGK